MTCTSKTGENFINKSEQMMENEHNLPRPHIHYTPPKGWMNDPNGLIFHDGVYHLYYQHYPDACTHGPMHWGHAESPRSGSLAESAHRPVPGRKRHHLFGQRRGPPTGRANRRWSPFTPAIRMRETAPTARPSAWLSAQTAATPMTNLKPTPYCARQSVIFGTRRCFSMKRPSDGSCRLR